MSDDPDLERIREEKAKELENLGITIMPNEIVHISNKNEWEELQTNYKGIPIAIDFSATWCMPCKFFAPIFEKIQQEYGSEMVFVHVDIDEFRELANGFGITGVPTTSIILGERELERQVGAAPEPMFREMVQRALEKVKS